MSFSRYALVTAGAAACAVGVLVIGAAVVLPMVCKDGFSPDRCLTDRPAAVVEDAPAIEKIAELPQPVPETTHREPRTLLNGGLQALQTRVVKVVAVRPQDAGLPPIVGAMSVPYPTVTDAGAVDVEPKIEAEAPVEAVEQPAVALASAVPLPVARPADLAVDDREHMVSTGSNVRSGPSSKDETVFVLAAGEDVVVGREDRGWVEVEDDEGRKGWVDEDYLKASN